MTKKAILKKRVIREFLKHSNWRYSESKGYPKGTYFGYDSFEKLWKEVLKEYTAYYGKNLKYWRYIL